MDRRIFLSMGITAVTAGKPPVKIFYAAITVRHIKDDLIIFTPIAGLFYSIKDASKSFLAEAMRRWPEDQGFDAHAALGIEEIPKGWIAAAQ